MEFGNSSGPDLVALTAKIISAYLANNRVAPADIAGLMASIYRSLGSLGTAPVAAPKPSNLVPAVPIKKSITPEYLVCLEDGKHFKSMKRHLAAKFGMSPGEYRARWGLPHDYPMVAAGYSEKRSKMATSFGLGRKKAETIAELVASKPAGSRKAVILNTKMVEG